MGTDQKGFANPIPLPVQFPWLSAQSVTAPVRGSDRSRMARMGTDQKGFVRTRFLCLFSFRVVRAIRDGSGPRIRSVTRWRGWARIKRDLRTRFLCLFSFRVVRAIRDGSRIARIRSVTDGADGHGSKGIIHEPDSSACSVSAGVRAIRDGSGPRIRSVTDGADGHGSKGICEPDSSACSVSVGVRVIRDGSGPRIRSVTDGADGHGSKGFGEPDSSACFSFRVVRVIRDSSGPRHP